MNYLQIENSYIGFLMCPTNGSEHFNDLQSAMKALFETINEFHYLLNEYPKAKWSVGYRDENDKWKQLFSISTAQIKKLKIQKLW